MKGAFPRLSLVLATAVTAALPLTSYAANPVQSLRADYGAVLDNLEASLLQNGNARSLKLLQQSRSSMNTVSDENFARLFEGGLPELTSSVGELKQYSMKARAKSAGLPAAGGIHSACSSNPYDSDSVYASLIAAQVTSSILAAATFVCTQDILGENGSAVCIPFAIADDIAQGIFAVRSWCAGEAGGAKSDASYERLSHIHDDLADARSTILNTESTNLTAILNNSNTNTTAINTNITTSTNSVLTAVNTSTAAIISNNTANTLAINNNIDAKATAIVNNANSNTSAIVNNANSNTTSIINTSNANKDAIVGELRALACELIRLMNTPEGQRASSVAQCSAAPGFPYSWNKK
jgi:hypothetical protein